MEVKLKMIETNFNTSRFFLLLMIKAKINYLTIIHRSGDE